MIARRDDAEPTPGTALPFLPERLSLKSLTIAVQGCRGCDLYKHATQAVFGEGPRTARMMFVGEQPGDQEDLQGKPFVGPAGRMLAKALDEVDIDRNDVYVTNAVKHFKFAARGKRRIHSKPSAREIKACKPWLEAELEVIKPNVLVALGATAAQSLFGPAFRVSTMRGKLIECDLAPMCMATVHPSSLLRAPDEAARREAWKEFINDFRKFASLYRKSVTAGT
jgi:uracil-DNA glycosylase family protein